MMAKILLAFKLSCSLFFSLQLFNRILRPEYMTSLSQKVTLVCLGANCLPTFKRWPLWYHGSEKMAWWFEVSRTQVSWAIDNLVTIQFVKMVFHGDSARFSLELSGVHLQGKIWQAVSAVRMMAEMLVIWRMIGKYLIVLLTTLGKLTFKY